ncbi:uncharacterized protein [Blastocystis hominis]|uniref:Uncharacterized protein n=1 Tax=Blastocystis hominis TaxID=12968 RepID=D8MBJ0_BLAHO|nr:uncharacterized protein [Blastocystis hominis]CBK25429.2 unnamed protein product [Blastocystis hominis]|eukprot:XP_012899477.1 uncharacterized protein [Blastocystis hominis]
MDEINRGASYPSIVSLFSPIFAHFESNSMVYPLLCSAAPPIYDSILTNALSNDAIPRLGRCGFPRGSSVENARRLIDRNLLDTLAVALSKPPSERSSVYLLRIVCLLCEFDVSLQAILNDATFCSLMQNYIMKIKEQSKELRELSEALLGLLMRHTSGDAQLEVLDPAKFSFGEPPKESIILV